VGPGHCYEPRVASTDLGRRVVVLGPSGSGKTTVGRALAERLGVPHVELDALFHARPRWQDLSRDEFRHAVARLLAAHADGWVVDGNYHGHVGDLVLPRADAVVVLRLPFRVVYPRLVRRTLARGWRKAELWNGNRETLRQAFFSRDSMLLWGVTAWRAHHRATARALATLPHGPVHALRSARAVGAFLASVADARGAR
jgi:adenylate kinase family enzyme